MTENQDPGNSSPIVGRTFWDIAITSTYFIGGALFLVALAIILYLVLDEVPTWFWIAVAGSFAFIPFLIDRAKEDADLFLVSNDAMNLTEYRVGKKYGLQIEGNGVLFVSDSGTYRTLLTDFDKENRTAQGSTFGNFTQIDQVRDMNTLQNLSILLEENLRESRMNAQTVGVEVEKQSRVIVDWALKTIYGSIIPNEISEVFGVDLKEAPEYEHRNVEDLAGDIIDE